MGIRRHHQGTSKYHRDPIVLTGPITLENRIAAFFIGAIGFILAYGIPNRFQFYVPRYLTLTSIDLAVPLVPWTIYIYTSEYIFFLVAYLLVTTEENYNRYLWSLAAVVLASSAFFMFFPTTYPRFDYPIPLGTHPFFAVPFEYMRQIDNPTCSFPSLHVSACFVTAMVFLKESRKKFIGMMIWAVLIALSTLTTKQHYLADVISGFFLAMISTYIFILRARYKSPDASFLRLRIGNWGN